jgi:RIO-like serine/threonine protein kinase
VTVLKGDLFGTVVLTEDAAGHVHVVRDARRTRWWVRWLARRLAKREACALEQLSGLAGVPGLLSREAGVVVREWIPGQPMHRAPIPDPGYFREALRLVRRMHARAVVHNDLAKEPNWLVTPEVQPAVVDFQLAMHMPRRGRLFRMLAHDDLRHLFKHKRTYLPQALTLRQQRVLARPSLVSRLWMAGGKPPYLFITRRLLGWSDREGADDRFHRVP